MSLKSAKICLFVNKICLFSINLANSVTELLQQYDIMIINIFQIYIVFYCRIHFWLTVCDRQWSSVIISDVLDRDCDWHDRCIIVIIASVSKCFMHDVWAKFPSEPIWFKWACYIRWFSVEITDNIWKVLVILKLLRNLFRFLGFLCFLHPGNSVFLQVLAIIQD